MIIKKRYAFFKILLWSLIVEVPLYSQIQPFSRNDSAFVLEAELNYTRAIQNNNVKQASGYLNELAFKYWTHNNFRKAIDYYEKSLKLNNGLGNENGEAMIYSNLGLLYADIKNYEKSYECFQKTLAARRSFDQKEGVVQALLNCSGALNAMKKYSESLGLLEEATLLSRQIKNQDLMLEYLLKCYANLSETYEKSGDFKKSRQFYDFYKTFLEKSKSMDIERLRSAVEEEKLLKEMAVINEKQKEQELLKKQFELRKAELELNTTDSLNKRLFDDLDKSQIQVVALRQKSEIDSLNRIQEQMKSEAIISKERSFRNILSIAALSLLTISFFIYRNFIQEKKSKKILAEKNEVIERQNAELTGLNKIIARHNERMKKELDVGQEIQMSMLPKVYPVPEALEMSAFLEPAREVGGDLYDFFMLDDDHLLFGIGDVSGKGVPAALFMAVTKTLVKAHGGKGVPPGEILSAVNLDIAASNEQSMFVSYFLGVLNVRSGELIYSNAGHLHPFLKNKQGCTRLESIHGPVLGAIENYTFTQARIILKPDEVLLLYTDGVTEAMNVKHELYTDERLFHYFQYYRFNTTKKLLDDIKMNVNQFTREEEQSDDITMIALRLKTQGLVSSSMPS